MKSIQICPNCNADVETDGSSQFGGLMYCPACDTNSIIAAPKIEKGDVIGEYSLTKKLGEGGMGTVWLAEKRKSNIKSAIKILHPHISQDENYISRFLKEARLTSQLKHPNIVETFHAGESNGNYY